MEELNLVEPTRIDNTQFSPRSFKRLQVDHVTLFPLVPVSYPGAAAVAFVVMQHHQTLPVRTVL